MAAHVTAETNAGEQVDACCLPDSLLASLRKRLSWLVAHDSNSGKPKRIRYGAGLAKNCNRTCRRPSSEGRLWPANCRQALLHPHAAHCPEWAPV